ncbi:MAG: carboxypeptidase regulatory-like domain-containing protein [Syntrophaceae bacterium]|nr:carboxypeptidase regulatory-like domain-containing protein [Syntrophaceae bacterium]
MTDQTNRPIAGARILHDCYPICNGGQQEAETDIDGNYELTLPNPDFQPHTISCHKNGYAARIQIPDVGVGNQTVPIQLDFVVNRLVNGIPAECLDQWYAYRRASRDYRVGKLQSNAQQLFNAAERAYNDLLDAMQEQGIENPRAQVEDVLYYRTTSNEIRPRNLNDGFD